MLLDAHQALVVAAPLNAKQMVVMSGPGSGKTRTAVERVKRLLDAGQKVVVITYTNAAAAEFAKRLQTPRPLGIHAVTGYREVEFCGTLHSYCFRLIRRFYRVAGYASANVVVLPEHDRTALLKQVALDLGIKRGLGKIVKEPTEPRCQQVWDEYRFRLCKDNLIDYDEILARGLAVLQDADVRVRAHVAIDTLVVDEAQDSGVIDWLLYRAIPAKHRFFIGDIDQAIFEFRQAYPIGLINLSKEADTTLYRLQSNYRCAPEICAAANKLIAHNVTRFEKDTLSVNASVSGSVTVECCDDQWQELEQLACRLHECGPARCAVLCRFNWDIDQIQGYLPSVGIPVYVARDTGAPRPQEWRRAMLLLGLAVSPHNEYLAEQLLLLDHKASQVHQWKLEAKIDGSMLVYSPGGIINRHSLLEYLSRNRVPIDTVNLIGKYLELLPPEATLADLQAGLYQSSETPHEQRENTVYTGTIHSAKGREFDVVFLPTMEEPDWIADANIEEERRLIFVALTRARQAVHISWAQTRRPRWGPWEQREPSRFIEEMALERQ